MTAAVVTGDCLQVMCEMEASSVDAVITDPPYGTEGDGYGRRQLGARKIIGDRDLSVLGDALPLMVRVLRPDSWLIVFASPRNQHDVARLLADAGLPVVGNLLWDKRQPGLGFPIRYSHEAILLAAKGKPEPSHALLSVLRAPRARWREFDGHPHDKPTAVVRELVRWACPVGGLVLDPFAGSGSTGVACVEERRCFLGIEIDPVHAATAERRLAVALPNLLSELTPEGAA